jgi:tRNA pseudouridine55 synthase
MIHGWLLIDKPVGISSFQAIRPFKKLGVKVGHSGTLDPFASGFLLVALGKATRLIEYAMDIKKDYTFTVKWGVSTDSYDLTGKVTEVVDRIPTKDEISKKIDNFLGRIEQLPPIFSAVKVNGRRAYDYARKGEDVVLKPKNVSLDSFSIISHNNATTTFNIITSKGFYVRSLARDLAKSLNTFAYVTVLRRNPSEIFKGKELLNIKNIKDFLHKDDFYDYLLPRILPLDCMLDDIPVYNLEQDTVDKLRNGQIINCLAAFQSNSMIAVKSGNQLVSLCIFNNNALKPIKVF